jgi:hypothetical protein
MEDSHVHGTEGGLHLQMPAAELVVQVAEWT